MDLALIAAAACGLLLGSIPSADLLARRRQIDLRTSGSGNPGTANALRVGGRGLAVQVLVVDLIKGALAALAGHLIAADAGAAIAAVAAVVGQVLNPWFRFRGGKGLGVAAGTAAALWPLGLLVAAPVFAVGARVLGTALGTLIGLAALVGAAALWVVQDWDTAGLLSSAAPLFWWAAGVALITAPKFIARVLRSK